MKISRLFVAVLASLITFAACEQPELDNGENDGNNQEEVENPGNEDPDDENDPEVKDETPKILLRETEIALESDGAAVNVAYMIENEVEDVKLVAATEAEWLHLNTDRARILSVSADPNESGAARDAKVVLSYEGAENVELNVSQAYYESPLTISISGVTATGVIFSVATTDDEMTWIPMVTYKESFEYFETADELVANDLEYFDYLADINDLTRTEFLQMMVATGSLDDVKLDGLQPSTDFVLYAYGITLEGRRTTDVVSMPFRTEDPYEGDITFTFDAVEEDYILNYTITPSHTGVPFYYDVATKEQVERWKLNYSNDLRAAIQAEVIDAEINELLELGFIKGPEDYYAIYNESNVVDWGYYELKASTTYVLYAVKWDQQCVLTGPVSTYEHTSASVDMSENQIILEVLNITQSSADASTSVTTTDPYVVMPVRKSEIVDMTDEEIFEFVTTKYDYIVNEYTYTGDNYKTFSRMRPDTEYTMLAFGYKAGTMTTSYMKKIDFVTLPAGRPEDCTFEFAVTPDVDYAFVEVTPSDKGQFYKWLVCPTFYTADDVKYFIDEVVREGYEGDFETFASWELSLGDDSANVWDLIEKTDYKVAAVIMDYDTGEYLSDVIFSEPFTTLEKVYANLEFQFDYGPYYDLGELITAGQTQLNPMLSQGDALFPIKLKVKGKCSAFYYALYQNDLSDEEMYTDEMFYAGLEYGCTYESSYTYVKYDQYMTLVAMAYDYDGNVTKLYRDVLFFTREGASPAEDFIASMKKASANFAQTEAPATVQPKAVSKKLSENRLSPREVQMKHEDAMAKVKELRRTRYMKEILDAKLRKEKMIAK